MVVQQVVLHKVIVALLPHTRLIHISLGQFSIHGDANENKDLDLQ